MSDTTKKEPLSTREEVSALMKEIGHDHSKLAALQIIELRKLRETIKNASQMVTLSNVASSSLGAIFRNAMEKPVGAKCPSCRVRTEEEE